MPVVITFYLSLFIQDYKVLDFERGIFFFFSYFPSVDFRRPHSRLQESPDQYHREKSSRIPVSWTSLHCDPLFCCHTVSPFWPHVETDVHPRHPHYPSSPITHSPCLRHRKTRNLTETIFPVMFVNEVRSSSGACCTKSPGGWGGWGCKWLISLSPPLFLSDGHYWRWVSVPDEDTPPDCHAGVQLPPTNCGSGHHPADGARCLVLPQPPEEGRFCSRNCVSCVTCVQPHWH